MPTAELVHCFRYRENERGELVDVGFDVMIRGRTVESDEEFCRLAEERARKFTGHRGVESRHASKVGETCEAVTTTRRSSPSDRPAPCSIAGVAPGRSSTKPSAARSADAVTPGGLLGDAFSSSASAAGLRT